MNGTTGKSPTAAAEMSNAPLGLSVWLNNGVLRLAGWSVMFVLSFTALQAQCGKISCDHTSFSESRGQVSSMPGQERWFSCSDGSSPEAARRPLVFPGLCPGPFLHGNSSALKEAEKGATAGIFSFQMKTGCLK